MLIFMMVTSESAGQTSGHRQLGRALGIGLGLARVVVFWSVIGWTATMRSL
jgi:hypothetical protein